VKMDLTAFYLTENGLNSGKRNCCWTDVARTCGKWNGCVGRRIRRVSFSTINAACGRGARNKGFDPRRDVTGSVSARNGRFGRFTNDRL
jgi:hypothetical protein